MKSYQLIIAFLGLGLAISNIWLAQDTNSGDTTSTWEIEMVQATETLQPNQQNMERIQNVVYRFCNSGLQDRLITDARPWEIIQICTIFGNRNSDTVDIIFGFPDWSINENWNIICDANLTGETQISQMLQRPQESDLFFSLLPKQQTIKKFYIKIPTTQTWSIFGCGSFKVDGNIQKAATWWMFNIELVMKAPIQINITWDVYKYWWLDNMQYTITDHKDIILQWFIVLIVILLLKSFLQEMHKKSKHKHTAKNKK